MRTHQSGRLLRLLRQGSQLGSYEGEESPVEDRGRERGKCSSSQRASDGPISGGSVVGGGARSQNGSNRLR